MKIMEERFLIKPEDSLVPETVMEGIGFMLTPEGRIFELYDEFDFSAIQDYYILLTENHRLTKSAVEKFAEAVSIRSKNGEFYQMFKENKEFFTAFKKRIVKVDVKKFKNFYEDGFGAVMYRVTAKKFDIHIPDYNIILVD